MLNRYAKQLLEPLGHLWLAKLMLCDERPGSRVVLRLAPSSFNARDARLIDPDSLCQLLLREP